MDELLKQKLLRLKEKNKIFIQRKKWQENNLLQECLKALDQYSILEDEDARLICSKMTSTFAINCAGHLCEGKEIEESKFKLREDKYYYIVFGNAETPIIACDGKRIVMNLEDIIPVSFETFFVSTDFDEIWEYSHCKLKRVGK